MVTIIGSPSMMMALIFVILVPENGNINHYTTHLYSLTVVNNVAGLDEFLAFGNSFTDEPLHVGHVQ